MASGLIWNWKEYSIRGVVFGEWFNMELERVLYQRGGFWQVVCLYGAVESIVSEGWCLASGLFIWSCREYCIRGVVFDKWFVYMEL